MFTQTELQELLKNGDITKEVYEKLLGSIDAKSDDKSEDKEEDDSKENDESIDYDKLERILQSRVDKATAKERKEKSDLKRKLERLQREKLTDDELKQVEIDEKEKAIIEREKAIIEKENRLYAVKAIKEAGLDDGSDTALSLIDFVIGEDETEIDRKVKSFKELFDKAVSAEVNKRFKDNGYIPNKTNLNGGKNPYSKESFSLTEQMALEATNPELAQQLRDVARKI